MRVITGTARGRRLITVDGTELVRPTPERVKEAIFSSVQFDIEGRRILDLFAGSGQLGIEALSRGAKSAVFVDASDVSVDVIKKNVKATGFESVSQIFKCDYKSFVKGTREKFDIAFLDPPYRAGILEDALCCVAEVMSDGGIILCEHPTDITLPENAGIFSVSRNYKYGKIAVTVYRKKAVADE